MKEFDYIRDELSKSSSRRRETYILKTYPKFYEYLKNDEFKDFESFSDKLNKFIFGGGYCAVCNKRTKKETGSPGFRTTCSSKCAGIHKRGLEPHNKIHLDEELVRKMYVDELKSPKDIGQHFNVSNVTVNKMIEKLGIKRTHSEQQKIHSIKGEAAWNSPQFDREKAYDIDYLKKENETKSVASIAFEIGCSGSLLFQQFKKNGVKVNNLTITKPEMMIQNLLSENNIEFVVNYRDGKEIDVYIPSKNIGIEIDGVYWHSEKFRDSTYHINKTDYFKEKGITILHFWDFEINAKFDLVSSMIKSKLNIIDNKIYARKCIIKDVEVSEARTFCEENHIQGYSNSKIKKGLYFESELVALATFGVPRFYKDADLELIRYCTKKDTNVIGGFSKLINTVKDQSLMSYANKRFSVGNVYEKNGFSLVRVTKPNFFWYNFNNNVMKGRLSDTRHYKLLQKENTYRVFDCGNNVYFKNKI